MKRFALGVVFVALAACDTGHLDLGGGAGPIAPAFAMGGDATCILGSDEVLRCYGTGVLGRFGVDPALLSDSCLGVPCAIMQPVHVSESVTSSFGVGDDFVCAIRDGVTRCTGGNAFGTLGRSVHDRNPHASAIPIDGTLTLIALVAGREHICGRTTTNEVACWGLGSHGQLGLDPSTLSDCGMPADAMEASTLRVGVSDTLRCAENATLVPGLSGITDLRAGPFATCAFSEADGWRCFGRNVDGSLGVIAASVAVHVPTALATADVVDVALGPDHGCVANALGQVFCFGHGELGQLGLGAILPDTCASGPCASSPTRVSDVPVSHRVAVGDAHSCVLADSGVMQCFGSDAEGQIGDSSAATDDCAGTPCARSPHPVAHVTTFTSVSARAAATCGHSRDGYLNCWGDGRHGEFGNYPPRSLDFPSRIYGIP